mmetsp:Transcript_15585/g.53204  ORF Transcript_15585/g.53204 Transcript_15585/m.53204 type:complete len:207 (+) Transcript_15585:165-785(+)
MASTTAAPESFAILRARPGATSASAATSTPSAATAAKRSAVSLARVDAEGRRTRCASPRRTASPPAHATSGQSSRSLNGSSPNAAQNAPSHFICAADASTRARPCHAAGSESCTACSGPNGFAADESEAWPRQSCRAALPASPPSSSTSKARDESSNSKRAWPTIMVLSRAAARFIENRESSRRPTEPSWRTTGSPFTTQPWEDAT